MSPPAPVVADPEVIHEPTTEDEHSTDVPWVVLVWNDPINLMSYVVYVFQKLFGYNEAKATEADAGRTQQGPCGGGLGNT